MPKGIFIVDANACVTWTNWQAESGLEVERGRIVTVRACDQKALNEAIDRALQSASGAPEPLTVVIEGPSSGSDDSRDHKRHIIHIVPMRRPQPPVQMSRATPSVAGSVAGSAAGEPLSSAPAGGPADGAMVFVIDPACGVSASPEFLQRHLGLTPSEARVASLVASGDNPRTLAAKLGLTEASARVILKRVFSKAGVSRQCELVALVSNLTTMPLR
jgi:DNA-binding CsgD family transcriptional regulator